MAAETGPQKATEADERTPEQIQAEIEETRRELGDTVAAVADKADVKKQARRKATETKARAQAKKDELVGTAAAAKDEAATKVREAAPDSAQQGAQQAGDAAQRAAATTVRTARENPAQAAAGALIAGILIGFFLGRR